MWRELLILAKMLFTKVEPNLKALLIVKMKHFPFRGYSAMQWRGHIIDREDDNVEISEEIMRHEMIHYKQACTLGSTSYYSLTIGQTRLVTINGNLVATGTFAYTGTSSN